MARLGIDYGTTNTVVVGHDRGRYPLVPHVTETAIGRVVREVFPSLIVYDTGAGLLRFGADAERCLVQPEAERRFIPLRSLKRMLRDYVDGARIATDLIPGGLDMGAVLEQFAAAVHASVRASGLMPPDEPLEAVLTLPANANGAQRHVTRRAFKAAGFDIIATLNEPSAAAIELADRLVHGDRLAARRLETAVAVFDLGGGTFDTAVVGINGTEYTVHSASGIETLGGDDFDELLARLFAEKLKLDFDALDHFHRTLLLIHACQQKERLSSGTVRNLTLDPEEIGLSGETCKVSTALFEKRLAERLAPAVDLLASVLDRAPLTFGAAGARLGAIYLVGGSSRLPLVARLVAQRLPGIRLVNTDKPFTATAMGAAIHSAERARVHDVFARHFGVIRLADHGTREYFAPIFRAGLRLPGDGEPPVVSEARYVPQHNIGHLRYLECATVNDDGTPAAGLRPWSDVLFPYDPSLPLTQRLTREQIAPRSDPQGAEAVETYTCDRDGIIAVRIARAADGQSRTFEIFKP